jgi:hypothetical protein
MQTHPSSITRQDFANKRILYIPKLLDGDRIIATSQEEKHLVLFEYYDCLLGTSTSRDSTSGAHLTALDVPFWEDGVWETIKTLPADDRAPGPDGFTGRFYKSCWPTIKRWQRSEHSSLALVPAAF